MRNGTRFLLTACLFACPALASAAGPKAAPTGAGPASWANDLTPIAAKEWNYARAAHLLERAGFGGTPEEVQKLAAMTPEKAVDYLVEYQAIDDSKLPAFVPSGIYPNGHKLVPLDQIVLGALLTGKAYGVKATQKPPLRYQPTVNEFYTLLISEHSEMRRASQWWAERMLVTPRPLQEKLTLFWHDHFATSQEKILNYELMLAHIETMRKHGNGNFRALLVAVAQDPAMLIWLDNRENVKGKPNENFAREVMELFTMGEGKGYTEKDIREMARAFTGWTTTPEATVKQKAKFIDSPNLHDKGIKEFLGQKGNFNGYDAIDIILKQPATPRFVSRKLYRYFVREDLSPELNDKLAKVLLKSKYDVKPLLKTIFLSRDFYSEPSYGTQIKAPVPFVISTYRKLGLRAIPGVPDCTETTTALGQLLFFPPNVAGWPGGRSWINPATLLVRGNFAQTLLFPGPGPYPTPDKIVADGYRRIPLTFPEYKIQPRVWDQKKGRMEPVSLRAYDHYLSGVKGSGMKGKVMEKAPPKKGEGVMVPDTKMTKSKMSKVANAEDYNLAVGVYTGFVEAYNRVKPIPRTPAELNLVAMTRAAKVTTAEGAVDYFGRRFLSVPLHADRRAAVVQFLRDELKSGTIDYKSKDLEVALRRALHLVLSAPEYQLG